MNDSRFIFFFFNDTATTEIYTLSLHDALPICDARFVHQWLEGVGGRRVAFRPQVGASLGARLVTAFAGEFAGGARRVVIIGSDCPGVDRRDRKSTRLNSSHGYISYAVFCLKKKKK